MTNSLVNRINILKERYSIPEYKGLLLQDIELCNLFAIDDELIITNYKDNSFIKYDVGDLSFKEKKDFSNYGLNWSTGYEKNNHNIWIVSDKTNELILFDIELNIKRKIKVNNNRGVFFNYNNNDYFIEGFFKPKKMFNVLSNELKEIESNLNNKGIINLLEVVYKNNDIYTYCMDSKQIFKFDGNNFNKITILNEIEGRIYRLKYLPDKDIFISLTNRIYDDRAEIYIYDGQFNFLRFIPFNDMFKIGYFTYLNNEDLLLGSRYNKKVYIFKGRLY